MAGSLCELDKSEGGKLAYASQRQLAIADAYHRQNPYLSGFWFSITKLPIYPVTKFFAMAGLPA
jgi:hypothetical protein